VKVAIIDKHSSLFRRGINCWRKKFYSADLGRQLRQYLFSSLTNIFDQH